MRDVKALYHRKSPRHNWIAYCFSVDNSPRYNVLCAALVRDTLYWQSENAQVALVNYPSYDGNVYDLPDNIKTLYNADIVAMGEAERRIVCNENLFKM